MEFKIGIIIMVLSVMIMRIAIGFISKTQHTMVEYDMVKQEQYPWIQLWIIILSKVMFCVGVISILVGVWNL